MASTTTHAFLFLDFLMSIFSLTLLPFFEVKHICILAFGLRYQGESRNSTQDVTGKENPEDIREPDDLWPTEVIEKQRGQDCTQFADSGTDTMPKSAHA